MGWYNASWKFRKKINVDYTKVGASLTDFQVYVNLADLGTNFFAHANADGSDIRITQSDGTTEQCIEVVSYSSAGTGALFFKGSSLSSTVNTAFYIYYGNSGASAYASNATYGKYNTWYTGSTSAVAVYHLEQDPSGSAPQLLDSTTNQRNLTTAGTMTSGDLVTAKILKGIDFDGTDDVASVAAADLSINNIFTVQFWMYPAVIGHGAGVYASTGSTNANRIYVMLYNNITYVRRVNFNLYNSANNGYVFDKLSTAQWDATTWAMFTGTYDGTNYAIYKNGTSSDTAAGTSGSTNTNRNIYLCQTNLLKYSGILDEFRLYNTTKTSTWISTDYNNQNSPSTFYAIGPEENRFIPRMMFI